jgi:hypothetical protein
MKKLTILLSVLFAVLYGQFALANNHAFAEGSGDATPPPLDQQPLPKWETATFALG